MSGKTIKRHFHVGGIDKKGNDVDHWYAPGDKLLPEHAELVTNESVFEDDDETLPENAGTLGLDQKPNYNNLNKASLEALCFERGLSDKGSRPEMIKRLEEADAASA
jgi:hypothetical protein